MIKIHDNVAVNPLNLAAILANDNGICFMLLNGRTHNLTCENTMDAFNQWMKTIDRYIPMLTVSEGRAINVDAMVSMAIVSTGIAFNMIGGHTEYCSVVGDENKRVAFGNFVNEINEIEKEAA